jgi:hypothetical protein
MEVFTNNASTTLAAALNDSDGTLTVHSSALFPAVGSSGADWFRVLIDSEILSVYAITGATWTVHRGVEGTAAAAHAEDAVVTHILTAEALRALPMNLIHGDIDFNPPVAGDFSWVNQDTAEPEDRYYTLGIKAPASSGGVRARVQTLASPNYYFETVISGGISSASGNGYVGICARQSSDGKLILFGFDRDGALFIARYTDPDTFDSVISPLTFPVTVAPGTQVRLEMENDDPTRTFTLVIGGIWFTIYSEAHDAFMVEDEVGFWADSGGDAYPAHVSLHSVNVWTW